MNILFISLGCDKNLVDSEVDAGDFWTAPRISDCTDDETTGRCDRDQHLLLYS